MHSLFSTNGAYFSSLSISSTICWKDEYYCRRGGSVIVRFLNIFFFLLGLSKVKATVSVF